MRVIFSMLWLLGATSVAHAGGPWRASENNTNGWALMTPRERLEHQTTVRAFTDYSACHAYQLQHHETLAKRAQSSGRALKPDPRDICAHLRVESTKP
jgi:hypothetical protein